MALYILLFTYQNDNYIYIYIMARPNADEDIEKLDTDSLLIRR